MHFRIFDQMLFVQDKVDTELHSHDGCARDGRLGFSSLLVCKLSKFLSHHDSFSGSWYAYNSQHNIRVHSSEDDHTLEWCKVQITNSR